MPRAVKRDCQFVRLTKKIFGRLKQVTSVKRSSLSRSLSAAGGTRTIFIIRSYIQDRLKYGLKKSRTNQKAALAS